MIRIRPDLINVQHDIYQRYGFLHDLIAHVFVRKGPEPLAVLDVGSGASRLSEAFLGSMATVTRADVDGFGDPDIVVLQPDGRLPFADDAFDLVIGIEVLEHVPRPQRHAVLEEYRRVARSGVVLCCPVADGGAAEAEAAFSAVLQELAGKDHDFLREHRTFGLPTIAEVSNLMTVDGWQLESIPNAPIDQWLLFNLVDLIYANDFGFSTEKSAYNATINRAGRPLLRDSKHYRQFFIATDQPAVWQRIRDFIDRVRVDAPEAKNDDAFTGFALHMAKFRQDLRAAERGVHEGIILALRNDVHSKAIALSELRAQGAATNAQIGQLAETISAASETSRRLHGEYAATIARLEVEAKLAVERNGIKDAEVAAARAREAAKDADIARLNDEATQVRQAAAANDAEIVSLQREVRNLTAARDELTAFRIWVRKNPLFALVWLTNRLGSGELQGMPSVVARHLSQLRRNSRVGRIVRQRLVVPIAVRTVEAYRSDRRAQKAVIALRHSGPGRMAWGVLRRSTLLRRSVEKLRTIPPVDRQHVQRSVTTSFVAPPDGAIAPVAVHPLLDIGYTPPIGLLPGFNPLHIEVVAALADQPHLNVLLPGLAMKHMSGGPNTAINLACRLAALGIHVRFISADAPIDPDPSAFWQHARSLAGIDDPTGKLSLIDASDRNKPLQIGENDIFMATAWWTAQMAKYALRHTRYDRFVYLIQDYEPLFHAASTQYALAEETYRLDCIPVFNSSLLAEFYFNAGVGRFKHPEFRAQAMVFEPAIDTTRFYPVPAAATARPRRRLLFYARPTTGQRNLFELGVAALQKLVADRLLDVRDWDFVGMGEAFDPVALGQGAELKPQPWHSFDDYAKLLRESDVLLSLMLSPHPSYPPLEMAACGRPVVTNVYANKTAERLGRISANIIAVQPTVEAIADGLVAAIAYDPVTSRHAAPTINAPGTWAESFSAVVPRLFETLLLLQGAPPLPEAARVDDTPLASAIFPGYRSWAADLYGVQKLAALQRRRGGYAAAEPGLISLITAVWNTDPSFLAQLAETVFGQDCGPGFEWIILDNDSHRPDTRRVLDQIAEHPAVRLFRLEENLGIIGGHHYLLKQARNRYIVPLDHDDLLMPDCVRVLTTALRLGGMPKLAYTDEDKLLGERGRDPYIKPDWDPVLFVHSCYTSHLCAFDRIQALKIHCYTNSASEGSPDWDSFMRFVLDGHLPLHVPEVVYTWRMHAASTALDIDSKPYIHSSQRSVLETFLRLGARSDRYRIELSPLFSGNPDWRFVRLDPIDMMVFATIELTPTFPVRTIARLLALLGPKVNLVHLIESGTTVVHADWTCEALTLMELFPDTDIVGGRVHDGAVIREAGFAFGYGGMIGCPDIGRALTDPGYSVQMWKPRSVGAVSARHCVVRLDRLKSALRMIPADCDLEMLGPWLGAAAGSAGRRVIYTPFLELQTSVQINPTPSTEATRALAARFGFLQRYTTGYPAALDHGGLAPYRLGVAQPVIPKSDYVTYCATHLADRMADAPAAGTGGPSFTILTTCYIKTDANLMRATAETVRGQNWHRVEWIILAHGPVSSTLSQLLDELAGRKKAVVLREPTNLGICGGLAFCLARASGDFVVPLDADDLLAPDALSLFAAHVANMPSVEILYSDEDMLIDGMPRHPYYRPDIDPVLLLTHSYIWHAIAYRRTTALALGVYTARQAEYAQDWDTLLRFYKAGHMPVHVPEVLYHWRQHQTSVSNSGQAFDGSRISVENILQKIASDTGRPELYKVSTDPFLPGASDSCLQRLPIDPPSGKLLLLGTRDQPAIRLGGCDPLGRCFATNPIPYDNNAVAAINWWLDGSAEEIVLLLGPGVVLDDWGGVWDAIKHLELVPRVMAVGGPVTGPDGTIILGAPVYLADGGLVDPFAGRPRLDPGAFATALKPHCVGALYVDLMVVRRTFLQQALAAMPGHLPLCALGIWLGQHAEATDGRVMYAPLLHGIVSSSDQLIACPIRPSGEGILKGGPGHSGVAPPPIRGVAAFTWNAFLHE